MKRYFKICLFLFFTIPSVALVQAKDRVPDFLELPFHQIFLAGASDNRTLFNQLTEWSKKGNARAMVLHGALLFESVNGLKQDYEKANILFSRAWSQGETLAGFWLGTAYWFGKGVQKNQETAIKFWTQSCSKGDVYSCESLALINNRRETEVSSAPLRQELFVNASKLGGFQNREMTE